MFKDGEPKESGGRRGNFPHQGGTGMGNVVLVRVVVGKKLTFSVMVWEFSKSNTAYRFRLFSSFFPV